MSRAPDGRDAELAAILEAADPDGTDDVPGDWDAVPRYNQPGKERMTIRIDHDEVGFFCATGIRWQPRADAVLRAFVLSRGKAGRGIPVGDGGGVQQLPMRNRKILQEAGIEAEVVARIVRAFDQREGGHWRMARIRGRVALTAQ